MRSFDEDDDFAIAELLRRAYARKVDLDTAARHLWRIDTAARRQRAQERSARSRRTVLALLTSLMLMATSGVAVAASGSTLPGDALYVVKRGSERVRLVLAVSPQTDAQVHLAIARRRWEEARHAAEARPDVVPGLLKDTFDALNTAERRGGDVAEQAVALRVEVTASSAELAFGSRPAAPPQDPSGTRKDGPEDVAANVPPASGATDAPDPEAGSDVDADTEADAAADAAAGADADAPAGADADIDADAETEADTGTDEATSSGDTSRVEPSPEQTSAPDASPAESPAVTDGDSRIADRRQPVGASPEPVAPAQPEPAATGEQTEPDASPSSPPTAPKWGRARP